MIDETIRKLILSDADARTLQQAARQQGMRTLTEDGWDKVRAGITTVAELLRVTQDQD